MSSQYDRYRKLSVVMQFDLLQDGSGVAVERVGWPEAMSLIEQFKTWRRCGYWLDTPEGVCVLLSVPACWAAALASVLWPSEARPLFLAAGPVLFFFTPALAFLYFVRFGQWQKRPFSSSWLRTFVVLMVIGFPFLFPYFRSGTP